MFYYKIKGVSPKSGKGTVYVIYRNGTEVAKSCGVTVNPKHFNSSTGKVSSRDVLFVNKNAQIQERTEAFQRACGFIEEYLDTPVTREAVEIGLQFEAEAPERVKEGRIVRIAQYREGISQKEARIEELKEELKELRKSVSFGKFLMDIDLGLSQEEKTDRLLTDYQKRLTALNDETAEVLCDIYELQQEAGIISGALFVEKIEEYCQIKLLNASMQPQTKGNYDLIATAINNFNPRLQMDDMNLQFFQEFQSHLMGRGVTNNSIRGMLSRIKGIYKYFADDHNLPTGFFSKFEQVKATKDENVLFLSPEELVELEALPLKARVHREVRQQFLFAVETGLRRSDYNITAANIKGREIIVTTKKTGKQVNIPATDKALRLFNEAGQSFRLIPESQFNQTLRLICQKMETMQVDSIKSFQVGKKITQKTFKKWQRMTSHVARKTFVENAVAKGVELIAIAEWLGHSDTQMLQKHYAHKGQIAKREAHKLLN